MPATIYARHCNPSRLTISFWIHPSPLRCQETHSPQGSADLLQQLPQIPQGSLAICFQFSLSAQHLIGYSANKGVCTSLVERRQREWGKVTIRRKNARWLAMKFQAMTNISIHMYQHAFFSCCLWAALQHSHLISDVFLLLGSEDLNSRH